MNGDFDLASALNSDLKFGARSGPCFGFGLKFGFGFGVLFWIGLLNGIRFEFCVGLGFAFGFRRDVNLQTVGP